MVTFILISSGVLGFILPFFAAIANSSRTAYLATGLSAPFFLIVAGYPPVYYLSLGFPALILLGGMLLQSRRRVALWLLFSPHIITVALLVSAFAMNA